MHQNFRRLLTKHIVLASSLCLALTVTAAAAAPAKSTHPLVATQFGKLAGVTNPATHISSFKGIPFAAPPVGNLRWRPPMPPAAWKGVRPATQFGASCMQRLHGTFGPWTPAFLVQNKVSEDCLSLNVWTPRVSAKADLPVIVFIPGGGFVEGSGEVPVYNGAHLASTGMVIVTINYRLGALGFLAYPGLTAESPHHSSGNYGILDQIAALKWVKRNIRAFGGNPEKITVWGQSAGAFSVGVLLESPLAYGLFEHAQADSGLGLAEPASDLAAAEKEGVKFAAEHHATSLKQLRAIPAAELLPAPGQPPIRFGVAVDGWVLPAAPTAMNRTAAGNDVPVITGNQANDYWLAMPRLHSAADYQALMARLYGPLAAGFKRLYPPGSTLAQMRQSIIESSRDRERVSMFLWASQRLEHHQGPVFTYFFDHAIPWPQHPEFGAFHSGELPYFFRNLNVLNRPWKSHDREISLTASSYLKYFAATGDPNGSGLPQWTAVSPSKPSTMEIGTRTGSMPLASKTRYEFWVKYFHSPEGKHAPLF
ncbi:MAG TPA: carboxylesterase family protein [Acidobacteriaceae bacterium]|nr:carboxylesterase family protein [Acidobacteriaceae bacterium]